MPCFTLVQVQVKDEAMARKALEKMGLNATITKNSNGTYTVTPEKQDYSFKDEFLKRYSVEVASAKARKEGYKVIEKEENGETVLYLRQY